MKKPAKSKPAKAKAAPIPLTLEQLFEAHRDRISRGHPTDLTLHNFREAIRLFATGVPESMIGPSLKPPLSRAVVNDWKTKGREDAAKGITSIFSEFSKCLREAEPLQEEYDLAVIHAAKAKDWRAAAWMLEHKPRTRDTYSKTVRTVAYTKAELDAMSIEDLERAARGEDPRRG